MSNPPGRQQRFVGTIAHGSNVSSGKIAQPLIALWSELAVKRSRDAVVAIWFPSARRQSVQTEGVDNREGP